jgi:hypothetical protein
MKLFSILGILFLFFFTPAYAGESEEKVKFPSRDIYKQKSRKPTPNTLKVNWKLLGLYDKKGRIVLVVMGKIEARIMETV